MSNSILIVEDHKETCEMLRAAIEDAGFSPVCAGGVRSALDYLKNNRPCLLVLDLQLPDGNGLEVCFRARESDSLADIPIIALTGQDELADKKKGFAAGVDQYLTKPIVMDELLMWIKALLRRVSIDKSGGTILEMRGLEMNAKAQLLKYNGEVIGNLTRREYQLLFALVKNSPKLLSRKEILSQVWQTVSVENLVDTHMFNLRNKLPAGLSAKIQSVPGKGFRYFDKG